MEPGALPGEGAHIRLTVISSTRVTLLRAVRIRGARHRYKQILGGESFTRWLVWALEIEKQFLTPLVERAKSSIFFTS